jgi:hypothetical protein
LEQERQRLASLEAHGIAHTRCSDVTLAELDVLLAQADELLGRIGTHAARARTTWPQVPPAYEPRATVEEIAAAAAGDAVDSSEDSVDPDDVQTLPAAIGATTDSTTARATLDVGDFGSWDVRHFSSPARRWPHSARAPAHSGDRARRPRRAPATAVECSCVVALIHIATDPGRWQRGGRHRHRRSGLAKRRGAG